ncbi:hypothetical protein BTVI_105710 [Pitangus sulphuratus]|nr:hypothetical protein BTVI_105710 [Pitangus sulphuratus]
MHRWDVQAERTGAEVSGGGCGAESGPLSGLSTDKGIEIAVSTKGVDSGFVPSVHDFDKKLTEADAYLQILIDQLKKIEGLKETTSSMVESIKHCIVLLQIAKDQNNEEKHADGLISTINPVDAVYQPSPLEPSGISAMPSQAVIPPGSGQSAPSSSLTSPSHVNLSPNTVPDFSYSSSEDEFYDADEFYQSSSSPKRCLESSGPAAVLTRSSTGSSMKRPDTTESLNSSMSNGTNDTDLFDPPDDREDDGEGESVEEHKSVIMHLLSQVRLGMDLTKVVLPTFILERRSLLEMYADFFAHPDLFVSISDQKDPKERMVQVVKWYLSAFHAGRKGSVAKKPYNPILGEIFRCHWVLPGSEVSAFYAECFSKRIQFNAHIWTKSKFLGMSIGVHNIGQGCVTCLDHDEHYILTFPNGYGRQENAVFIDTKKMPTIKKKVRKLEDQDDFESRCLWKDVTYNLKIRDIDAATAAKHALEERQRAEARARKESETSWETRLFHEDGECWVYDEPLLKRLAASKH